ncbi:MAG: hypothetical protein SOX32_00880 [Candidatus Choladocola sp.]|nr:hypothetical protein [Candidatus Choladocola sp.]
MEIYSLTQWVLFFYIYCFLGWIWESAFVSVCERKPVNRGFLKGPFLPIYGSGAVCVLVVTIPFRGNIPAMFLVGMVSATVLEYITGDIMERLFRVRYWDYTGKFLNVNGYICLKSTICWGVMTVLVVDVVQPFIEGFVLRLGEPLVTGTVLVITPLITADFVTSFHAAIRLRDILVQNERLKEELQKLTEKKRELENALLVAGEKAKAQLTQELQELLIKTGEQKEKMHIAYGGAIRGLLKRNPRAVSRKHKEAFAETKRALMEKIEEMRG